MFCKKTYRDTRWMEKVMSTARPLRTGECLPATSTWLIIDPKYAIDAHISGGWVDVNYIRMIGIRTLQCHTGCGILTLKPSDHELVKVVYLKQFDAAKYDYEINTRNRRTAH